MINANDITVSRPPSILAVNSDLLPSSQSMSFYELLVIHFDLNSIKLLVPFPGVAA